jgi:RNA polymerase sigma factor (sigma-70 family)
MDEWELLQRYAQGGSEAAFAELVGRHVNFVYSSARRQVRSPQLAEEVTQNVFVELARQAARLERGTPLTAWLYVVTRRAALNALRGELRRQAREHAAYELSAMNPAPSVWEKLAPLLDEALEALDPRDRSALLLRYFDNKPLRDVGAALNTSEDAAQKRVSRALEQLRTPSPARELPSARRASRRSFPPMASRPLRRRLAGSSPARPPRRLPILPRPPRRSPMLLQ